MKFRNSNIYSISGVAAATMIMLLISNTVLFAQLPQEQREAPPMEQQPQEQMQREIAYEDEIEEDELPEAVVTSVKETWADYEINEIYRGSDGSYKVNLGRGDEKVTAFYDSVGEFLRVKEENEEDTINDDWR